MDMHATMNPQSAPKPSRFIGKSIGEVETPAAIIDVSVVKRNCQRMLDACKVMNFRWRGHVKTHKTVEITRLQLGENPSMPARIIISTTEEAEFLLPLFAEYRAQGRTVDILYGLPIAPGQIPRLAAIGRVLGPGSISVLIDHPAQLQFMSAFKDSGVMPHAYIKVNMGGERAGVRYNSPIMKEVIIECLKAHHRGAIILTGMYSHAGHSYGGGSSDAAMQMLRQELIHLNMSSRLILETRDELAQSLNESLPLPPLVLSVGASPTALSVQNIVPETAVEKDSETPMHGLVTSELEAIQKAGHIPELHAGVYPLLDLQQLAAHSLSESLLSWRDIAFTVIAEVHSLYPGRGEGGTPEVLIGAGVLALGRETCKAYPGMAILTPWGRKGIEIPECKVEEFEGYVVSRFSQEHGIVTWMSRDQSSIDKENAPKNGGQEQEEPDQLTVGQKIRLWPNHSCITSSHFPWYLVVDSSRQGKEDEIIDIYMRARGWCSA